MRIFKLAATIFAVLTPVLFFIESTASDQCESYNDTNDCLEIKSNKHTHQKNKFIHATGLNFTLRGIVAGDDKYPGLAIIQLKDTEEEQVFIVNDEIFGQATLEKINRDHIVLLHDDKSKIMRLDGETLSSEHYLNSDEVKAARKRVATNYRKRFLSRNGMDLINLFGFKPLHRGGFQGFIITALGDEGREMMEVLGVMEGDLITVVNDMRLSEDLKAIEKLKELKTATSVDVIIERDGNEIPFHFELEEPTTTSGDKPEQIAGDNELPGNQTTSSTLLEKSGTAEHVDHTKTDANTETVTTTIADDDDIAQVEEDDLGEDWGVSQEDQQYMDEQKARINHPTGKHELEYDH